MLVAVGDVCLMILRLMMPAVMLLIMVIRDDAADA